MAAQKPPIPPHKILPHPQLRNYRNNEDVGEMPLNHANSASTKFVIKCPECRQVTRVPPKGLPVNYRLQGYLGFVLHS
ncbi:unnamed protein product [Strongylus vulgaris]|uniref:Uncharacterized protein n=1 Tax=Strongylus vulgaris TaxID=40348 RepID=A0A3P7J6R5_STRVU|nr:unnamed protein product [Strongylus vulgaris]